VTVVVKWGPPIYGIMTYVAYESKQVKLLLQNMFDKKAMLLRGNRAKHRVFAYIQWLLDCYLHSLHKSRCESETVNKLQHDAVCYLLYLYSPISPAISGWSLGADADVGVCRDWTPSANRPWDYFRNIPTYVTTIFQCHGWTDGWTNDWQYCALRCIAWCRWTPIWSCII